MGDEQEPADGGDEVDVFAIYDFLYVPHSPRPAFDADGKRILRATADSEIPVPESPPAPRPETIANPSGPPPETSDPKPPRPPVPPPPITDEDRHPPTLPRLRLEPLTTPATYARAYTFCLAATTLIPVLVGIGCAIFPGVGQSAADTLPGLNLAVIPIYSGLIVGLYGFVGHRLKSSELSRFCWCSPIAMNRKSHPFTIYVILTSVVVANVVCFIGFREGLALLGLFSFNTAVLYLATIRSTHRRMAREAAAAFDTVQTSLARGLAPIAGGWHDVLRDVVAAILVRCIDSLYPIPGHAGYRPELSSHSLADEYDPLFFKVAIHATIPPADLKDRVATMVNDGRGVLGTAIATAEAPHVFVDELRAIARNRWAGRPNV